MRVFTSSFVLPSVLKLRAAIMIRSAMTINGDARLIPPSINNTSTIRHESNSAATPAMSAMSVSDRVCYVNGSYIHAVWDQVSPGFVVQREAFTLPKVCVLHYVTVALSSSIMMTLIILITQRFPLF